MCGIAAYIGEQRPGGVLATWRMMHAQRHRGPDGAGLAWAHARSWRAFTAPTVPELEIDPEPTGCVLGHNWLAIQDRAAACAQPMCAGPLALTFNGEIYDFVELRESLEREGERFETGSDTEVLLTLWRREGEACLSRLRGMYAFVIHDASTGRTWAARDPFGIKPLHVAQAEGATLFASEIRAIHATGLVERRLDETAVLAFAAGGVNTFGERGTLYVGVEEVPPGTIVTIEADGARSERSFASLPRLECDSEGAEAIDLLRGEFERCVDIHLRACRHIATCMSGGLDSTNLAWAIGRRLGHADFDAYTFETDPERPVEAQRAAAIAREGGLRHHLVRVPGPTPVRDLVEMVVACETPNHVIGPINQFLLFREMAADGATVLLDGQGGDELMSGYPWYTPHLLDAIASRGGDVEALRRACAAHRPLPEGTYEKLLAAFASPEGWVRHMMGGDAFLGVGAEEVARLPCTRDYVGEDHDWAGFRERTYRRGELAVLLRQEDRLGMWHGLECRVPFVDGPLVAAGARLAPELLIRDGYLKYPLRVLYEEMPRDVRFDVAKSGFWDMGRSRFAGIGGVATRLMLGSDVLRRVLPDLERDRKSIRRDDRVRLMQVAILERASTREEARELANEIERAHASA